VADESWGVHGDDGQVASRKMRLGEPVGLQEFFLWQAESPQTSESEAPNESWDDCDDEGGRQVASRETRPGEMACLDAPAPSFPKLRVRAGTLTRLRLRTPSA